ncbi:MAG: lysophospholipid acyltransferase family protein [Candidatus Krumholzibacteriia bacterium]|nr:lysophospholipid acyltransferase family protein [bacterium]MCB9516556.1 lysophospholipid acyltransferase family protein [Candidatus Latescibacterota bacterium]
MSTLIALRLGLLVARVLPLPLLGAAAAGLWRLGGRFSPRRRVVAANLAAVAAAGGRSARPGDVFACYGRYWAELLHLGADPRRIERLERRIRVEGGEHLERALAKGGICFLTAHLGNWDLLSRWAARHIPSPAALAERLEPPALSAFFIAMRAAGGVATLHAEGSGLTLYRYLKQGGMLGVLADRVFGRGTDAGVGVRAVPMLGGARRLPTAGIELARRSGATLLPIFLLRERGGYVIKVLPPLAAETDPVTAFARALGTAIADDPGQWCVLYPLHDGDAPAWPAPSGRMKGAAA